jgi:hypothetical protein
MLLIVAADDASAQYFGVTPPRDQQQQQQQQQPPPQEFQQQQQAPNVCANFVPIRQEAEKGMAALNSANERKAPREEFCQIFKKLASTTGKIAKFLADHQGQCNVPVEAVQRAKADNSKIVGYRNQACSAPAAPAGPRLSDVLGAPIPETNPNRPNDSIFNTLTGNPLTR